MGIEGFESLGFFGGWILLGLQDLGFGGLFSGFRD